MSIARKIGFGVICAILSLSCGEKSNAQPREIANPFGMFEPTVEIAAVGDMMFARGVASHMDSAGFAAPLANVAEYLSEFDITTGNLECPVSKFGSPMAKKYVFRADPRIISELANAGFDLVNVANNHAFDYGLKCFCDGLDRLENGGIQTVGGGRNLRDALEPRYIDAKGITFGFLGFNDTKTNYIGKNRPACAPAYEPWLFEDIRKARENCDVLIVQIHWGEEYRLFPTNRQTELAHAMVDSGVDVVLGHHPHCWEGVEFYREGIIAYSLGNFIFDQRDLTNNITGILELTFTGSKLISVAVRPVELLTFPKEPHLAHPPESDIFYGYLTECCLPFGTELSRSGENISLEQF